MSAPPLRHARWKGHPTDRKALNVRKCRSPCPPGQEDPHEDPHDGPHIDFGYLVFAFIIIFNLASREELVLLCWRRTTIV